MKEADLFSEYAEIHDLYHKFEIAHANGSDTAPEYMDQIKKRIDQTGLANDLSITGMNEEAMEQVHLYLHEIDGNSLPYVLHTYGRPDVPDAVEETVSLILKQNPDADPQKSKSILTPPPPLKSTI